MIAMSGEANPLIADLGLELNLGFSEGLPCRLYSGKVNDKEVYVCINGKMLGYDLVGCEAAVLATERAISFVDPDIVISYGTCGAFAKKGASIGDVYLSKPIVMFHDRRVPGDPTGIQSVGNYPSLDTSFIAKALGLKQGKITTGSSLGMSEEDKRIIEEEGGECKDMEAAAVAFVCLLHRMPFFAVKAVTDFVDSPADTFDAFKENFELATRNLLVETKRIIEYFE